MTYLHKDLQDIEIGKYVETPGIEGESVPEETTTMEAETDESGNIIETETDEYGNVIEPITDVLPKPDDIYDEETTIEEVLSEEDSSVEGESGSEEDTTTEANTESPTEVRPLPMTIVFRLSQL